MSDLRRPTKRVLGYARVSSTEQALGTSLQDQQNAIAAYASSLGMKVDRFFVEAESGIGEKIERREQMRLLMAEAREGDLVVCDKLDRWSRDIEFTYASTRQIRERGASFYAVADRIDPSTHDGAMLMGFKAVFAQDEHRRIRERMVGTRKLLRNQGYYSEGPPPFGYRRAHPKGYKGAEKNVLVAHPEEAAVVRQVFRMCIAGSSLAAITAATGLARTKLATILHCRAYVGEIQDSKGAWIRARHDAIVDADTLVQAQASLETRALGGARPRTHRGATSTWILRDVAQCAQCGARMRSVYASSKEDLHRHYYRCSRGCRPYCRVVDVEALAAPLVLVRLTELREELARPPEPESRVQVVDYASRRASIAAKRGRYLEAFADGHMSREDLRAKMAKLDADSFRLDGEEGASRKTSPLADVAVRRATMKAVGVLARAWKHASPEERRAIVGRLATAARLAVGSVHFTWRTAEDLSKEHE